MLNMTQPIQFLSASNVISRQSGVPRQELSFSMLVGKLAYDKQVEVYWAGEDGQWYGLRATYQYDAGNEWEVWRAATHVRLTEERPLPGNIQFALRYVVNGQEHWDNNGGADYHIDADSGARLRPGQSLLNLEHQPRLEVGQKSLPVTVAVQRHLRPRRVVLCWSIDGWQTRHETTCSFVRTHWDRTALSNARNPNQYGTEIWTGRIRVDGAYQLEYAILCEGVSETVWDNNLGTNYATSRARLKVLTLNLHCYQESDQDTKFSRIAQLINQRDVDLICLQEVGENWNDGHGDWPSNAARIIQERLRGSYYLHTDWSHIGFDHYREGVAILSKYPFQLTDSGYVSASQDPYSIHSRKVVMGQVRVPYVGLINVFSVHLSWWEDGFEEQFRNLRSWAAHKSGRDVVATLLCGDFNVKAGSRGYSEVVATQEYDDQFLRATAGDKFRQVFRNGGGNPRETLANDYRIDYIWLRKESRLRVAKAEVLFTDENYGRVSDHPGYYAEFHLE